MAFPCVPAEERALLQATAKDVVIELALGSVLEKCFQPNRFENLLSRLSKRKRRQET